MTETWCSNVAQIFLNNTIQAWNSGFFLFLGRLPYLVGSIALPIAVGRGEEMNSQRENVNNLVQVLN